MRQLLGNEFDAFISGYTNPSRRGLRFNLLKYDDSHPHNIIPTPLTPVPWCREGYEYPPESRPAKSILYSAGLFYIQEPSAMSPAAILRPQPGQRVLDICAAPGGKSVQLAGYMQGQGVLVSNDISPSRCRALVKNLEMAGVTNAIVLTEKPNRLADRFPAYFDCILVDAPCSGEGMFRRDPDAAKAYTTNKPESCAVLQQEILRHAAAMLKPGGRLVYSTCTFNPLENEIAVAKFLAAHPDFELLPINHTSLGLSQGLSELANPAAWDGRTARIWPHTAPGEGHFIALMAKAGESKPTAGNRTINQSRLPEEFTTFCEENLHNSSFLDPNKIIHHHNNALFLQPESLNLSGLRVARSGWLLGECAKGRFIPSQALAMGITKNQARYAIDLPEPEALRYLKGESLTPPSQGFTPPPGKPWILICHGGFPLGWARLVQGRLKNQLPTSWVVS